MCWQKGLGLLGITQSDEVVYINHSEYRNRTLDQDALIVTKWVAGFFARFYH